MPINSKKDNEKNGNPSGRLRNGGEWTDARYHGFVTSALRAASRRWPPKYKCLAEAFVGRKTNPKTKREGKHYKCAICLGDYPSSMVQIDHIDPIINPKTGFISWDDYIDKLFCEKENLQCVCVDCHKEKTKQERAEAQQWKSKPVTKQKKAR